MKISDKNFTPIICVLSKITFEKPNSFMFNSTIRKRLLHVRSSILRQKFAIVWAYVVSLLFTVHVAYLMNL